MTDENERSISDYRIAVGTVVFYGQIVEITSIISVWTCHNLEPATFSLQHIQNTRQSVINKVVQIFINDMANIHIYI